MAVTTQFPLITTTFNSSSTLPKLTNRKETNALNLTSSSSSSRNLTDSLSSKLTLFVKIMMQI